MSTLIHGLTEEELSELARRTIDAKDVTYCPYSNFRVGACILCEDGSWVIGGNVENASYPVSICAERTAIVKAVTEGKKNFKALALAADTAPPVAPCGMCRQFIREFSPLTIPIFMYDKDGKYIVKTLNELLPMSFGPEDLHRHGGSHLGGDEKA